MKNIDRDFLDKELSRRGQVNLDDLNLDKLEIDGLDLDNIDFDNMDFDEMMEIGGMIEQALDTEEFREIEDLIEMPSKETFQEWIELGEQKYRKRVRRKRILSACAAVLIICIGAVAAINCFKPPTVEAGLEDRMMIESVHMESIEVYKTWSDLPQEIQDQFIEVKDLPDGYVVEAIILRDGECIKQIDYDATNGNQTIRIRQTNYVDGMQPSNIVDEKNVEMYIGNAKVYFETYKEEMNTHSYKYVVGNLVIDIIVPASIEEYIIQDIINNF